jgi:hypothetical protein
VLSATGTGGAEGASTALVLDARLADGQARLSGTLEPRGEGLAVALAAFRYSRAGVDLALAAPTTIFVENGTARFDSARLMPGTGA